VSVYILERSGDSNTTTPMGGLLFPITGAFCEFEEIKFALQKGKTQAAATAYRASDRAAMNP
jgi:hypothetical protein